METPLEILFQEVWRNVFWTTFVISLIAGVILSLVLTAYARIAGCVMAVVSLLILIVGSLVFANLRATEATTTAYEKAKADKATYVEKLHGFWVGYGEDTHACRYRDNDSDINDTGCEYVTRDSYCDRRDDDGDCVDTDYRFTPWFKFERTLYGELNVFKRGHYVFASHIAPLDWSNNKYSLLSLPLWAKPGVDFVFATNPDWLRVKNAVDSKAVLPGSVYNTYFNWIHSDDLSLFKEYGGYIDQYQELGLLPTINKIHSGNGQAIDINIHGQATGVGFDYDVVQFLNLDIPETSKKQWQSTAAMWTGMAGPQIQSSLILVFAPERLVPEMFQWVKTSKAYLMQKDVFGRYILPKNMVLLVCVVSDNLTTITQCEAETGMFKGNEAFINDVRNLNSLPFDPTSFFGSYNASFSLDNLGNPVLEDYDWDDRESVALRQAEVTFTGGLMDAVIRDGNGHGFSRVEMAEFEYKKLTLQPDPEQIDQIKANMLFAGIKNIGMVWLVVLVILGGLAKAASES